MKIKGIALPIIVFTVSALVALASVFFLLEKPEATQLDEKFSTLRRSDSDALQKTLALIETQRQNTEKTLNDQINQNLQASLQSLTSRVKGELEGYINVSQQLALTSAAEKLNLDRKQQNPSHEVILLPRLPQQVQYLPVSTREGRFDRTQRDRTPVQVVKRELDVVYANPAIATYDVTLSDLPDYQLAAQEQDSVSLPVGLTRRKK